MSQILRMLAAVLACGAVVCTAAGPTQEGTQQASGGNAAAPKLTEQSSMDEILDALHQVGENLRSLEATITLTEIDNDTGNPTARPGRVFLAREGDQVKFRATLTGVMVERDGKQALRAEKIEYVLRDGELIDRNYQTRTQVIRKLPVEDGKRDLLKLGEGPFPLPIGQTREEVLRQFDVREVNPADEKQNEMGIEAREGTRRLRLTPKKDSDLSDDFKWLEIDVSLSDAMPAQVIALNATGSSVQVTEFRSVKLNGEVPAKAFDLEPIKLSEWNSVYEDLNERRASSARPPKTPAEP